MCITVRAPANSRQLELLLLPMLLLLKMNTAIFVVLVVICNANKLPQTINIVNPDQLEKYLCDARYVHDMVLLLNTSFIHYIQYEGFCVVDTIHSLTIQSDTNTSYAVIQCSNSTKPTTGFAFAHPSILKLQKVIFKYCGAAISHLQNYILRYVNSTGPVYFTQFHNAVLVFVKSNMYVSLIDVQVRNYYGYAVIGINIICCSFEGVVISNNSLSKKIVSETNHSMGSGMLFLFRDFEYLYGPREIHIRNSHISQNYEFISDVKCITDVYNSRQKYLPSLPVLNAAGLTLLYTQHSFDVMTNISNCSLLNNSGQPASGMLIMHLNSTTDSQTIIYNGSTFHSERQMEESICNGHSLQFYNYNFLPLESSLIQHHKCLMQLMISDTSFQPTGFATTTHGGIKIIISNPLFPLKINLKNVFFSRNFGNTPGVCVFAAVIEDEDLGKSGSHEIIMDTIKAINNSQKLSTRASAAGLFQFYHVNKVLITGSEFPSVFYKNYGSVIKAIHTDVILQGQMNFLNNFGMRGAAINVENGRIYLTEGLEAYFANNKVITKGGAIYASTDTSYAYAISMCPFQIPISANINMHFEDNEAFQPGTSIYVTRLYNCLMNNSVITTTNEVYEKTFKFSNKSGLNNISTLPHTLSYCKNNKPTNVSNSNLSSYPGELIEIQIAALDETEKNVVYSPVTVSVGFRNLEKAISNENFDWKLSLGQEEQTVRACCTTMYVSIRAYDNVTISEQGSGVVVFSIPDTDVETYLDIVIHLHHCPVGFNLDKNAKLCVCSPVLNNLQINYIPYCNISARAFTVPEVNSWAGLIAVYNKTMNNYTNVFAVSLYCRINYCIFAVVGEYFRVNETGSYVVRIESNDVFNLCRANREGFLCSKCSVLHGHQLSVVFGSGECKYCSNAWLLTIIVYALAGPLLVYFLCVLRLTLTSGTLNGILFYAHVANVGSLEGLISLFPANGHYILRYFATFCNIFLSLLNLNLGFPLCFYDGMTELWKTGLSLVFPIYLLIIVVVLIILSRYSTWISNRISHSSVQVLVTVVHMSFSKLLWTSVDVFTPNKVYVNTSVVPLKVWYNDGTVFYGSREHIILMTITLLVVGLVIIPYVIVLIGGHTLMKVKYIRKYLRPIHESIHAPYKDNKQYWFTLRLMLVVIAITLYVSWRAKDYLTGYVIGIPVLMIYITGQAYAKPFKSKAINILDLIILVNFACVFGTTWYYYTKELVWKATVIIVTMNLFLFIIFLGILVYHVLWVTGKLETCERVMKNSFQKIEKRKTQNRKIISALLSSYTDDEFREPLLGGEF